MFSSSFSSSSPSGSFPSSGSSSSSGCCPSSGLSSPSGFCPSSGLFSSSGFCSSLFLLIQFTVAVAVPVLPASSTNSNVNSPLSLKTYLSLPELLTIVTFSLNPDNVAVTDLSVSSVMS